MIDLIAGAAKLLKSSGFEAEEASIGARRTMVFEDPTVLGFVIAYESPLDLAKNWSGDTSAAIGRYQFGLRRSGQKAWNLYVVLVAPGTPTTSEFAALAAIEEDLVGTRKIARGGINDLADLASALLPLLPIQAAPILEAVDIPAEIRLRVTELPPRAVDAFFSDAEDSIVLQVLEEGS